MKKIKIEIEFDNKRMLIEREKQDLREMDYAYLLIILFLIFFFAGVVICIT